jgi:Ca-activated chloride channel family protein
MLARDVRPNRIERAKAEVLRMIRELDGDRVGVVAFAGETMEFPMTVDYAALGLFFRDLGPYDMPVGGTAIGRALTAAGRLLERSQPQGEDQATRAKVVVLMTDGEDHEGDPVAAARALAEAGVRVYTVGIGSRTGEPIPMYSADGTWTGYVRDEQGNPVTTALTAENEATLRQVAEATGGKYFRADRGTVGVDQIRAELRRMDQTELAARRVTVHEERYALALLPAFLLLTLEGLLPDAWIGRRRRRRTTKEATA